MSKHASAAERYRTRAAELRAIAEGLKGESERDLILDVAREYEQMAKTAKIADAATRSKSPL